MKIRLNKEVNGAPQGSIVEVDELTAKTLIRVQEAIEYTDDVELAEKKQAVKEEVNVPNIVVKRTKIMENIIGKAFRSIYDQKAVTGMSEGTAADGGNLIGTAVAEVMGIALSNSKVWSKCKKITLPDKTNSIKVPIDASDPWIVTSVPVPNFPAEGGQKTATKLAFGAQTLTLGKTVFYIPVTDELLSDVGMLDQFVRQYAFQKLAGTLDTACLSGAASYSGVVGNATYTTSVNISTAPTMDQIYSAVAAIDPRLSPEWYMGPADWVQCKYAFVKADNLSMQLIDPNGMKLAGLPVNILPQLSRIVIGDFSQYCVAVPSINDIMAVSEHIRFDYDETVYRLVHRSAGAPCWTVRTAADGTAIGAFANSSL